LATGFGSTLFPPQMKLPGIGIGAYEILLKCDTQTNETPARKGDRRFAPVKIMQEGENVKADCVGMKNRWAKTWREQKTAPKTRHDQAARHAASS
jgi:hypothetical protein